MAEPFSISSIHASGSLISLLYQQKFPNQLALCSSPIC